MAAWSSGSRESHPAFAYLPRRWFRLTVSLSLLAGVAGAAPELAPGDPPPLRVYRDFTPRSLVGHVAVYEDPTATRSASEVQALPSSAFVPHTGSEFDFGITESAVWLRFVLANVEAQPNTAALTTQLVRADLACRTPDGALLVTATRGPGSSHFLVQIPASERATCWLRVAGGKPGLTFPLMLTSDAEMFRDVRQRSTVVFGYLGCGAALIAFSLGLWIFTREPLYGLYATMVATAVLASLEFTGQLGLPERMAPVPFVLAPLGTLLFARAVLSTRREAPRLDLVLRGASVAGLLYLPVAFAFMGPTMRAGTSLVYVALTALTPLACIVRLLQGNVAARVFVLAVVARPLGSILAALQAFGAATIGPFQMAAFAEVVAWLLAGQALAVRIRQLQEQVRAYEAHLVETEKLGAVSRVVGGVAHDLNNYLTTIQGFAALLLDRDPRDRQKGPLRLVADASRRAIAVSRQLLGLSREARTPREILAADAVFEAMRPLLDSMAGERVALELEIAEPDLRVDAGRSDLEQIALNLVLNARDASPPGGVVCMRVEGLSSAEGERVRIQVSDRGSGIPGEVRERLFDPFVTTKPHGSGLGLATVRRIAEELGGHAGVDTRAGWTTTLSVEVPRSREPLSALAPEPDAAAAATSLDVLVVDDQAGIRTVVAATLEAAGHRVRTASEGEEALRVAKAMEALDLVVTDVVMPGMGGLELYERLRGTRPSARFLFVSGHLAREDAERIELSGERLLPKPFTPRDLLDAVGHEGAGALPAGGAVADLARAGR